MNRKWNAQKAAMWTAAILAPLVLLAQPYHLDRFVNALSADNRPAALEAALLFILVLAFWAAVAAGVCKVRNWFVSKREELK